MREGMDLQELYQLAGGERIVVLVSPFHIYGLLHSIFLPLCAGADVVIVDNLPELL